MKRFIPIILAAVTLLCSCGSYSAVEKGENYSITQSNENHKYHYKISDNDGKILAEEDSLNCPKIQAVSDNIIEVKNGSGNADYCQYFDVENGKKSKLFENQITADHGKIVYAAIKDDKLILVVRDLFDESEFYKEFALDFSPVANPSDSVVSVQFIENSSQLRVKYLSGDDYTEKTADLKL